MGKPIPGVTEREGAAEGSGAFDGDKDGLTGEEEAYYKTDPDNPDSDGDGLSDGWEVAHGTDPNKADSDGDGWDDKWEVEHGTDPKIPDRDSDGDGLPDGYEEGIGTDPNKADSDGDGYDDGWEDSHGYDPLDSGDPGQDRDGDGYPDTWEEEHGYDPEDAGDPDSAADEDQDGLTTREEFDHHTDPKDGDSDGDGLPDGWEVAHGLDPLDGEGDNGPDGDPDKDGLSNREEAALGTHPNRPDSDGDGYNDGWEVRYQGEAYEGDHLDPRVDDTAWLPPGEDADQDGLSNKSEEEQGTNPFSADTDGDGYSDGLEIANGYDPLDPGEHPEVDNTLVITDGKFLGPAGTRYPRIQFTTAGYEGGAYVYSVVTGKGASPAWSAFTLLEEAPVLAGTYEREVTLPGEAGQYDVHVCLFKDGKLSAKIIISTAGSLDVVVTW
jgi:hypothetical protein